MLPVEVGPGQDCRLVGELFREDAVDEFAPLVGQPDVRDPAVTGVTAPLDQTSLGQLLQALGDGGTGGERLPGDLAGRQLVPGPPQRAEDVELGAGESGPAQRRVLRLLKERGTPVDTADDLHGPGVEVGPHGLPLPHHRRHGVPGPGRACSGGTRSRCLYGPAALRLRSRGPAVHPALARVDGIPGFRAPARGSLGARPPGAGARILRATVADGRVTRPADVGVLRLRPPRVGVPVRRPPVRCRHARAPSKECSPCRRTVAASVRCAACSTGITRSSGKARCHHSPHGRVGGGAEVDDGGGEAAAGGLQGSGLGVFAGEDPRGVLAGALHGGEGVLDAVMRPAGWSRRPRPRSRSGRRRGCPRPGR